MFRVVAVLCVALAGVGFAPHLGPVVSYASHQQALVPGSAGRALVLEPFATQLGPGPNAGDPEVNNLQQAGYQVDQVYDNKVTVQTMTTLPQYNVVYMRTHADPVPGGDGVVATGQLANDDTAIAPYLQDGSVVKVHVSTATGESTELYYAITSVFVQKHMAPLPQNSLLFLNGCAMLKAPIFAHTLQQQGLGVMLSWDNEATSVDNYLSGAAFMGQMRQGASVADAIKTIQAAGLGYSKAEGQDKATLGYIGDGTITLAKAATGTTASPQPTTGPPATPKPPTPGKTAVPTTVPTPVPTATVSPVLPLAVQLRQAVRPGKKQLIVVRSDPDTVVHIGIVFPNGDSRHATIATNSSGVAQFAFVQHASKITYHHTLATVTIDAVKNGATSSKTMQYRIGWSAVDVSIQPRQQAVGKSVWISVHTRSNTRVTAFLHFPSGAVTRIKSATGSDGWVQMRYRIQRYLKKPGKHVVVVRVSARYPHRFRHGDSTFQIT